MIQRFKIITDRTDSWIVRERFEPPVNVRNGDVMLFRGINPDRGVVVRRRGVLYVWFRILGYRAERTLTFTSTTDTPFAEGETSETFHAFGDIIEP